jgi:hypothetical protein
VLTLVVYYGLMDDVFLRVLDKNVDKKSISSHKKGDI